MPFVEHRRLFAAALGSLACASVGFGFRSASAEPQSNAVINGAATPVYFNDGDTFRVLAGEMAGTAARLGGFNTLESYGPVHQWKGWTFRELYANAKLGTLNARRGVWHCNADPNEVDAYGRMLAVCLDLAEDQIRKGFAHAYSVEGPSPPRLIAAQRDAIVNRHGMWAKGIPAFVMTSLHSVDEGYKGGNYNRLISTTDGQSRKWEHQNEYAECQRVCYEAPELTPDRAREVIAALRAASTTSRIVRGFEDPYLTVALNQWIDTSELPAIFAPGDQKAVEGELQRMKSGGELSGVRRVEASCMVYVAFDRRYRTKPSCLKW